jgi:hypothetical protein
MERRKPVIANSSYLSHRTFSIEFARRWTQQVCRRGCSLLMSWRTSGGRAAAIDAAPGSDERGDAPHDFTDEEWMFVGRS